MSDVDDRAAKDTAGQLLDRLLAEKYGSDPSNTYARLRGENEDMQAFRRVIDETRIRHTAAPDPPPVRVEQTILPIQTVRQDSATPGPGSSDSAPGIGGSTPDLPTDDGYYVLHIDGDTATWVKLDTADAAICVDGTTTARSVLVLPA